jgi:hypothetical protein
VSERHWFVPSNDPLICADCGQPQWSSTTGPDFYHKGRPGQSQPRPATSHVHEYRCSCGESCPHVAALDELRDISAAGTPGPWKGNDTVIWRDGDPALDAAIAANDGKAGPIIAGEINTGKGPWTASTFGTRPVRGANARLIVAAVNWLRAALDGEQNARDSR